MTSFANEIIDVAEGHSRAVLAAARGLSITVTAHALSANQSWPNVTVPFFEIRSEEARKQADLHGFLLTPIVVEADRMAWEAYSTANQGWLHEGLAYRGLGDVEPGNISETIFAFTEAEQNTGSEQSMGSEQSTGSFLPVWQMGAAPTNSSVVNLDISSHKAFRILLDQVLETREAALSPVVDVRFLCEYSETDEDEEGEDDEKKPHAFVLHPVFATFDEDAEIVGFIIAIFSWEHFFFNDIVIQDMVVVLGDTCGSNYTYKINSAAELLGLGTFHDKRFNSLLTHKEFEPFQGGNDEGNGEEGVHSTGICKVSRTSLSVSSCLGDLSLTIFASSIRLTYIPAELCKIGIPQKTLRSTHSSSF